MKRHLPFTLCALLLASTPGVATEPVIEPAAEPAAIPSTETSETGETNDSTSTPAADERLTRPTRPHAHARGLRKPRLPQEGSPEKVVGDFFERLKTGDVDAAYDQLLEGTRIAETPSDVLMLKKKTRDAIKLVGGVADWGIKSNESPVAPLRGITCIMKGNEYPLQWRFFFYESAKGWRLIDIRISDRLADIFDDPTIEKAENR